MAVKSHIVEMLIRVRDQASRRLGLIGKSSRALGGALKYMAAGLTAYIGVRQIGGLLKFGAEFEKTMSRVSVLSQATAADQERLETTAKRLGAMTAFTAQQVAEGMSFLALAGFEVNDIIRAMPSTLNLAAAGQLELSNAADITAKVMKGLGITADGLGGAVDVLARAFTTANTDLNQLGEAMSYVGPIGRTAGKDLVELTAAIQVMSNAGVQASQAGTSLRMILSALSKGTPAAAKAIEKLKIETVGADGALRPLPDIVEDFNKAMEGMGKAEKTATLMQIFGKRAGPGMAAMLNEGSMALRIFEKDLRAAGGTAQEIAEKQLDNVAGSLTKIKSVLADIRLTVFGAQKGALKNYLDDLMITLQGVAFDIRNMQLTWDTAMTAMTLSAVTAGEKIWKVLRFLPPIAIANLGTKVSTGKWMGERFSGDKEALQKHLTRLILEREKKFVADLTGRGGAPGAPGVTPPAPAPPPEDPVKKVAKALAEIKGGTGPLEARMLTMAPGATADPVARNTKEQVAEAKRARRLLARIAFYQEQLFMRLAPGQTQPVANIRMADFK